MSFSYDTEKEKEMKISILYVSQTGNTEAAAEYIQDGILAKYPFIQVKLMDIRENEVDAKFLEESEAVIFGSPVYFTSMSWELKKWFDQSFRISLEGKLGAVFVTAQSASGGTDTAIMEILRHMLLKGMLVFSGTDRSALHHSRTKSTTWRQSPCPHRTGYRNTSASRRCSSP